MEGGRGENGRGWDGCRWEKIMCRLDKMKMRGYIWKLGIFVLGESPLLLLLLVPSLISFVLSLRRMGLGPLKLIWMEGKRNIKINNNIHDNCFYHLIVSKFNLAQKDSCYILLILISSI